jgi:hypothetical protein
LNQFFHQAPFPRQSLKRYPEHLDDLQHQTQFLPISVGSLVEFTKSFSNSPLPQLVLTPLPEVKTSSP